ncbi:hypothetical protein PROFUN_09917 [Planoprotostelium fungivorum]|uniref:Uncharacterized protein n=1 Tax=Planoprotostelium fungivorum TaxID=1890364 RepID=A0A2P6NG78_9EUKA|nr:hypothetical protein PROFUN_09917 [Planoprotostelium fungivorum]
MQRYSALFFILALVGLVQAATLSGSITASDGQTTSSGESYNLLKTKYLNTKPYHMNITLTDAAGKSFSVLSTDGRYSFVVDNHTTVSLSASSLKNRIFSSWRIPYLLPTSYDSISIGAEDKSFDIVLQPAFTLILIEYNSDGSMKTFDQFSTLVWTVDEYEAPTLGYRVRLEDADHMTSTLGLSIPKTSSIVSIMSSVSVDSQVMVLPIDNSGNGYGPLSQPGKVVYTNRETALTSIHRVKAKNARSNYLPVASDVIARDDAQSFGYQMSTPSEAALASQLIMNNTAAENQLELTRAEKYGKMRQHNVTVKVQGEKKDFTVALYKLASNFQYGVQASPFNYNVTSVWKQLKDIGINSATVDFSWSTIDSTTSQLEKEIELKGHIATLLSMGFNLKATGLFQPAGKIAVKRDVVEFGAALGRHVTSIVGTFLRNFTLIDVSTDLNRLGQKLGFNSTELLHLQRVSLQAVQSAAPGVRTSISVSNDYVPTEISWKLPLSFQNFSRQWIAAGLTVDQVGFRFNSDSATSPLSLGQLSDVLDGVASLGRPVRVSSFSVPASVKDKKTFLRNFYAVAAAKKGVKEITFHGIVGSLFDENSAPTGLFNALREALASSTTGQDFTPDHQGNVKITAPAGDFSIHVKKAGKVVASSTTRLEEGRTTEAYVLQDSASGKVTVVYNAMATPIANPAPAPAPAPPSPTPAVYYQNENNGGPSGTHLAPWGVALIVLGCILAVSTITLALAFVVLKRRSNGSTASPSKDGESVGQTNATVGLEEQPKEEMTPEKWTEGPLCVNVALDEEEEEEEEETDEDRTSDEEVMEGEEGTTSDDSYEEETL